jgi:mRNA interferase RelE/StbE
MPAYDLKVAASAERTLARLPEYAAAAIVEFMTGPLRENPQRLGKPLVLDFAGYYSARRGAYRVIYRIDEAGSAIVVVRIDHRADIYRGR